MQKAIRILECYCLAVLILMACKEASGVILNEDRIYDEGPHIVQNGDSTRVLYFSVSDGTWALMEEEVGQLSEQEFAVDNPLIDSFVVKVSGDREIVSGEYPSARRIMVVSDIEGNFTALYSLLVGQEIIDEDAHWIYGDGHLVMLGDLFDRGPDVTPTLWLLYRLESEARRAGGYVHIVLGNHEIMIFDGDTRYVNNKYERQCNDVGISYTYLYSTETVLGRWLRTKPGIIKIGDLLLSHAGISPDVLRLQLDLEEINDIVREKNLYQVIGTGTPEFEAVFGSHGIFWYRGWVDDPPSEAVLDEILEKYNVAHVVIGHTIVPDIRASFDYKLVMADVWQSGDIHRSPARALLIEGDAFYEVNSRGERRRIKSN